MFQIQKPLRSARDRPRQHDGEWSSQGGQVHSSFIHYLKRTMDL